MTKINAKIIKHSVDHRGNELITYELVFPRFLLAELNTHRMFSKNSASSRAIPFKKMVEMVKTDAFIPSAWQKEHKGMQGSEYITNEKEIANLTEEWLIARDYAVQQATRLNSGIANRSDFEERYEQRCGVTKQLCNRLLEPFMWHKVLLTTGKGGLQNFFELRCPEYEYYEEGKLLEVFKSKKEYSSKYCLDKPYTRIIPIIDLNSIEWLQFNKGQAEIHMMELAESMYDTYNESVPQKLKAGEWHIPYDDIIDTQLKEDGHGVYFGNHYTTLIKASTGLCARTSYLTVGDDKSPSIETLIGIHDKMVNAVPKHSSPMEHIARVMSDEEYYMFSKGMDGQKDHEHGWCLNFRGFMQYRYILEQGK